MTFMNELNKISEHLEKVKGDLVLLNDVYNDIFQPWIVVKSNVAENAIENCESDNKSTDLNLLYKLQNVLIKASNLKEKSVNEINVIPERKVSWKCVKSESSEIKIKSANNNNKCELKGKKPLINKHQTSQQTNLKVRFIPAHKTAPFKTDPSLHQRKVKSDNRNRIITSSQFSKRNLCPISEKVSSQNQTIDTKPINNQLIVEDDKSKTLDIKSDTNNVDQMLSQLQKDIERLKEVPTIEEVKIDSPKFEMKTIFEAKYIISKEIIICKSHVRDKLIFPSDFKNECRMYSKLMSKLSSVYLQKLRKDSPTNRQKFKESFLESSQNPMQLVALETHTITIVHDVLEQIINIIKMFDLESCTITQIGFMQACLSWILREYMNIKSNHSQIESPNLQTRPHSKSHEIRQWLDYKLKSRNSTDELHKSVMKSLSLTNCPFVRAVDVRRNQPISLTVPQLSFPPFKFCVENNHRLLEPVNEHELAIRELVTQQHFRLSLAPLMGKWIKEFKEKRKQGESLSSSYRQIYGLFLGKYPVILKEMS